MYSPRKRLGTPDDYKFPYTPYAIQQQFMESMYNILENKGIGIFESPTGTGKSLTLTCAALRWLDDHEREVRTDLVQHIKDTEVNIQLLKADLAKSTDWITGQYSVTQQNDELHKLKALQSLLKQHEENLCNLRERYAQKCKENSKLKWKDISEDKNILGRNDNIDNQQEENSFENNKNDYFEKNSVEQYRDVQIFFCSRTHSQLAQVVREVKATSYGKNIRCISLASRQQLCIHPEIRRLSNVALINEHCLDMVRAGDKNKKVTNKEDENETNCSRSKSSKCCPYKSTHAVQQLSDTFLMDVIDIEELVAEGERTKSCPYYAARSSINNAQIVMLPYQMLLHRRTRIQSGIDLRGSIIIIDEAHNLIDTIAQLYSSELTLKQLLLAHEQILAYKKFYEKRFSTSNLLRINQLLFVVKRLIKLLDLKANLSTITSRFLRTYELTSEGEFFNINLFEIIEFCDQTSFARKLQGFIKSKPNVLKENEFKQNNGSATTATVEMLKRLQEEHQSNSISKNKNKDKRTVENNENEDIENIGVKNRDNFVNPIRPLLSFLLALTEDADDGRVLIQINSLGESEKSLFKYILLNPSGHFDDIVRESRAIIIAGGTMQPTTDLTEQLFRLCPERVQLHFYDHVVPLDAVLPLVIATGSTGRRMCFNYEQRSSKETLSELGMTIQNLCFVIPDGVICFLPSYDYLDKVYDHLSRTGIIERISARKVIFRETRSNAAGQSVEKLLEKYDIAIQNERGALLFGVVGGKMSEGLNFADRLGRGVIVVGLPYPNRHSAELQERMKWLDKNLKVGSGEEYYENLCMKAVNQCIGRSVRHIRDYASVFLLDERYGNERIKKKLPKWISRNLQEPSTFGGVQVATAKFFKEKRKLLN